MERARIEIVSVALSASRDRQSRKAATKSPDGRKQTMSWTPNRLVLGLTFRIGYNITLATRPGGKKPKMQAQHVAMLEDAYDQLPTPLCGQPHLRILHGRDGVHTHDEHTCNASLELPLEVVIRKPPITTYCATIKLSVLPDTLGTLTGNGSEKPTRLGATPG